MTAGDWPRMEHADMIALYLDFDGVLHPVGMTLDLGVTDPGAMRAAGLFAAVDPLAATLAPFDEVRIVISSSWRSLFELADLRALLGPLGGRVIGTTGQPWWTRYEEVAGHAFLRRIDRWLALDDDDRGWGEEDAGRLLRTDPERGLTQADLVELGRRLRGMGNSVQGDSNFRL